MTLTAFSIRPSAVSLDTDDAALQCGGSLISSRAGPKPNTGGRAKSKTQSQTPVEHDHTYTRPPATAGNGGVDDCSFPKMVAWFTRKLVPRTLQAPASVETSLTEARTAYVCDATTGETATTRLLEAG